MHIRRKVLNAQRPPRFDRFTQTDTDSESYDEGDDEPPRKMGRTVYAHAIN